MLRHEARPCMLTLCIPLGENMEGTVFATCDSLLALEHYRRSAWHEEGGGAAMYGGEAFEGDQSLLRCGFSWFSHRYPHLITLMRSMQGTHGGSPGAASY